MDVFGTNVNLVDFFNFSLKQGRWNSSRCHWEAYPARMESMLGAR
jgi:hypothetical protein